MSSYVRLQVKMQFRVADGHPKKHGLVRVRGTRGSPAIASEVHNLAPSRNICGQFWKLVCYTIMDKVAGGFIRSRGRPSLIHSLTDPFTHSPTHPPAHSLTSTSLTHFYLTYSFLPHSLASSSPIHSPLPHLFFFHSLTPTSIIHSLLP